MGLTDDIIRVLSEGMGPAAHTFYRSVCNSLKVDPAKISGEDIDAFAKYTYAQAKRSLDEETAMSLYNRLLSLKK